MFFYVKVPKKIISREIMLVNLIFVIFLGCEPDVIVFYKVFFLAA